METSPNTGGFLEAERMQPVTTDQMKRIEDSGQAMGIPKILMMENAGSSIARFIYQNLGYFSEDEGSGKLKILLVAGTGNNGGDAFAAARHLAYWNENFLTTVALIGKPEEVRAEEAKLNFKVLRRITAVSLIQIASDADLGRFEKILKSSDLVVVGIFGTGFRGESRPLQRRIIQTINDDSRVQKISIDIPSGMEADSGNFTIAVRSDFTITMHAPKQGLIQNQAARELCGRILVANIGVPR